MKRLALLALAACSSPASHRAPVAAAAQPGQPTAIDLSACPAPPPTPPAIATPIQVLDTKHGSSILDFAFDTHGRLATTSQDGSVRVWSLATGSLVSVIHDPALGQYIKNVYWIDDHLALLGDYLKTKTVDLVGNEIAANEPNRLTFGELNASNQTHSVRVDRGTTHAILKIPDDINPFTIDHVAVAADGHAAAASARNLVLVWRSLDEPPARTTLAKRIEQLAIDPAGKVVAAGFEVTFSKESKIAMIEVGTNESRELFGVSPFLPAGDHVLAFSPDGKRIAAAQVGELRVWDVAGGLEVAHVGATHSLLAESGGRDWGSIMNVAWSPDGRWLVVASADGRLEAFDAATLHRARPLGADITRPFGIALSGDALLAVGPHSVMRWSVPRARLEDRDVDEGIHGMALRDGDVIVARAPEFSSGCHGNEHAYYFDRWHGVEVPPAREPRTTWEPRPKTVPWLPPPGSLRAEYDDARCVAADRALPDLFDPLETTGTIDFDKTKEIVLYPPGKPPVTLESSPGSAYFLGVAAVIGPRVFAVSGGGMGLGNHLAVWTLATGKLERTFDLKNGAFTGVHRFLVDGDVVVLMYGDAIAARSLTDGHALWDLTLASAPRAVGKHGNAYVVGLADGTLALVRDGKVVEQVHSAGGEIDQVVVDSAAKRAATLSVDGSVRIWDLAAKLRERVAFASFEDGEWIAYTPGGAYAGTPEVATRIGWTWAATGESYGFEQLAQAYEQPALVARRAGGEDVDVATSVRRPPTATAMLVAPAANGIARIAVAATSPTRVDTIRAYVEGRVVASVRPCSANASATLNVPIAGDQRVAIAAFDADGLTSNPALVDIAAPATARPDVWIVAAGISHYSGLEPESQLAFAADDARAVSAAFANLAGPGKPYARAHVVPVLVDADVSATSLAAALGQLAAMKPTDLAVLFMSGHGIELANGDAALLTTTATDATAVRWSQLVAQLDKLAGRVLVLLDACHAGHLTRDKVVPNAALAGKLARASRAGVVVFAASKGRQESFELGSGKAKGIARVHVEVPHAPKPDAHLAEGHGIFTDVLVRDLADVASDGDGDGTLDVDELVRAVQRGVSEITEGAQTPWLARREVFGSFTVVPRAAPPK